MVLSELYYRRNKKTNLCTFMIFCIRIFYKVGLQTGIWIQHPWTDDGNFTHMCTSGRQAPLSRTWSIIFKSTGRTYIEHIEKGLILTSSKTLKPTWLFQYKRKYEIHQYFFFYDSSLLFRNKQQRTIFKKQIPKSFISIHIYIAQKHTKWLFFFCRIRMPFHIQNKNLACTRIKHYSDRL